jgi:mono/diheme cytochrome c family protein
MRIRNLFIITLVTLIPVTFFVYAFASDNLFIQQKQSDKKELSRNPLDGRLVFEHNNCINCHSINGFGGKTAPDFNSENFLSGEYELITDMWNHSPKMLKMIDQLNAKQQKMSTEDFRKLRYFIAFLGYISKNGSVSKGQDLFVQMNCAKCHSVGKSVPGKISLDKTGYNASPIYLAQVMWNHAAEMHKKQETSKITIPVFKGNEFASLAAYLESMSTPGKKNKNLMYPGNPVQGEKLFNSKNCAYCHLKEKIGAALDKINLHKSVNEIAGMMWNHSSLMESAMWEKNISWPSFKESEMGNLIAYLYFYNTGQVNGSVEEGQKLLVSKGCNGCHYNGNPDKTISAYEIQSFDNIDEFFSKLWNHIQIIEKEFYTNGKELPKLVPEEVKSMYLYFNRSQR